VQSFYLGPNIIYTRRAPYRGPKGIINQGFYLAGALIGISFKASIKQSAIVTASMASSLWLLYWAGFKEVIICAAKYSLLLNPRVLPLSAGKAVFVGNVFMVIFFIVYAK
jgi:hypothetical protein